MELGLLLLYSMIDHTALGWNFSMYMNQANCSSFTFFFENPKYKLLVKLTISLLEYFQLCLSSNIILGTDSNPLKNHTLCKNERTTDNQTLLPTSAGLCSSTTVLSIVLYCFHSLHIHITVKIHRSKKI